MSDFPECGSMTGNVRRLCRGEIATLEACNHMRAGWGFAPLTQMTVSVSISPQPMTGPGTELKKLLEKLGIAMKETCGCRAHSFQMNAWGVSGCREHLDEIAQWLRDAAKDVPTVEKIAAAWNGLRTGVLVNPADAYRGLVLLAIERAETR